MSMSKSMAMAGISCSYVKYSLTNINNLSDDILQEIFARLPSRSVARCNCVRKKWLGLISSPSFIHFFICRQHSLYNTFLMFISPREVMLIFPHVFDESQSHPQSLSTQNTPSSLVSNVTGQSQTLVSSTMLLKGTVCGSSNGLLLGCNTRYTCGYGYYVYDPISKECVQLPNPPITYQKCIYAVGFVCDSFNYKDKKKETLISNRNYRVVIIPSFIEEFTIFRVEVFSSETKEWERLNVSLPNGFSFARHWFLSFEYKGWLYFMGTQNIFVFDPYGYDSYTLAYPEDANAMNIMSFGFLGSSCGSLRISEIDSKDVKVWELQDDGKWQQIHQTDLSPYLPNNFCSDYHKRIGGLHPYDGDIVYLCSYIYGAFVANLRTNKFEAIPGYDKCDISPFQLEMPLPVPLMSSQE
ncbi:hypothetical protein RIF29_34752 [Crotalaria pallida]|uniref:F-box protein At3g26010-like beta-propeller domain-containing protein n=1 Tax=Crotalaria pallida TaxID=3830 RepID=A0AAN9EBF8_CROPI